MPSFKPHPQHSGKPANQGGHAAPHVQQPKTSGKPERAGNQDAPQTKQDKRGFRTPGKGGSGKGGPKPFKG